MHNLDAAYELVTSAAPGTALALLVGKSQTARTNAISVLRLAMMFDEEDWKFMRLWLDEQVSGEMNKGELDGI